MPVQLSDTRPGMVLLDKRRNSVCAVVGVNYDAGRIWLTDEAADLSQAEFDARKYEEYDPAQSVVSRVAGAEP